MQLFEICNTFYLVCQFKSNACLRSGAYTAIFFYACQSITLYLNRVFEMEELEETVKEGQIN